jgi:hypothetical protein
MSKPSFRGRLPIGLAFAALGYATTGEAIEPSDLCTGNPCIVSGPVAIAESAALDFGAATELRFAKTARVVLGATPVSFSAGSIVVESGAQLRAIPTLLGAELAFEAAFGSLEIGRTAAQVVTISLPAGSLDLTASEDVLARTNLAVSAKGEDGGTLTILANGRVELGGKINANGRARASEGNVFGGNGGRVDVSAGLDVAVDAAIQARATLIDLEFPSGREAGTIRLESTGGSVAVEGDLDLRGVSGGSAGGVVDLSAATDVLFASRLRASGHGNVANGSYFYGEGGELLVDAGGSVTLAAPVHLRGGNGGTGGRIDIVAAGDLIQLEEATVDLTCPSSGPNIFGGGTGDAGSFEANVRDAILWNVDAGAQHRGGDIRVVATGSVTVLGTLRAKFRRTGYNSGGSAGDGDIELRGCDVTIDAAAVLDTDSGEFDPQRASPGTTRLVGGGSIVVAGTVLASGQNFVTYRSVPPSLGGFFTPPPVVTQDPDLPPCS